MTQVDQYQQELNRLRLCIAELEGEVADLRAQLAMRRVGTVTGAFATAKHTYQGPPCQEAA